MKKKRRDKPDPGRKDKRGQKRPASPPQPDTDHDDPAMERFYDELPYKVIRPKPQGGQNESSDG